MTDLEYKTRYNELSSSKTKFINISSVCYFLKQDNENKTEKLLKSIGIKSECIMGYDKYYLVDDLIVAINMIKEGKICL